MNLMWWVGAGLVVAFVVLVVLVVVSTRANTKPHSGDDRDDVHDPTR